MWMQLVLADFRERTRRYSFLITLGFVLFFGYLVNTGKYAITLGACRGVYNSAWVGSLMTMGSTSLLVLLGFFLVNNSIKRDRVTGVGQILASTRMSKRSYLWSKFISNFLTLSLMAAILVAAAVVMQWLGDSGEPLKLWTLLAPFLFVTFPAVTLVSALAVLFESVRALRGSIGNVLYFFLAQSLILAGAFAGVSLLDITGIGIFLPSMERAARAAFPQAKLGLEMGFVGFIKESPGTVSQFRWEGVQWTADIISGKFFMLAIAVLLIFLADHFFKRFDPALDVPAYDKPLGQGKKKWERSSETNMKTAEKNGSLLPQAMPKIRDLAVTVPDFHFIGLLAAELRLLLKGYHRVWYGLASLFIVLQLALPYELARAIMLPLAWIWPILLWSSLGTREKRFNTSQLLFSSPYPVARQLPAVWIAGFTVTVITGSGMMVRALLQGDIAFLFSLGAASCFIPTLALFLGISSGSKKPFEVTYMIIWYLGAINRVTNFDFMGVSQPAIAAHVPSAYFIAGIILLPAIFLIRKKQML